MNNIDKRNKLEDNVFSFRTTKDGKVFIYWYGKQVTILKGKKAFKFMSKIDRADEKQKQLIMAKETGNFKRGNEK
ncbi:MAG: hypothetical protein FH751_15050 [Firmicutes bacterium]|nr:hypothetical protein [Bacillota bacterium]